MDQILREQARQIGQIAIAVRALTQAIEILSNEMQRLKERMMLLEEERAIDDLNEPRTVN